MRVAIMLSLVLTYALYSLIDTEYLTEYQTKTTAHVVQSGDSLWSIAEKHYRSDSNVAFNAYMENVRNENGFAVGGGRKHLQPGEVVYITQRIPVK